MKTEIEMDADGKFWLSIWKVVAVCFCVLVASLAGCTMNENLASERLVRAGNHPADVRCLFGSQENGRALVCMERARAK